MISFRTIATMAKWDCQTIVATTEGDGERERAPVCHLREGGRGGGKAADTNVVKSLCKKRTSPAAAVTHGHLLLGVGADLAWGIP